ncbi:MAG: signal peptidase I [Clostridia bacterium]|nr:signal peptidase I [Clostridia bacterium]
MKVKRCKKGGVVRIILIVIISVVFGFGVYNWNAKSLTGDVLPMPFGIGVGVVMSGSMEPVISTGDLIIVQKQDSYAVNQIVVFQQNGILVVHQILSIDGNTVVTQGTANDSPDEPMDISRIKGRVIAHASNIGSVVKWIKSPIGTLLVLAIAGYLLIKSYRQEDSELKNDKEEQLALIRQEIQKLKDNNKNE